MKRQAQAALEFMVTYGWALLSLVAIIGILIYFAGGRAEDAIPASCNFNTGFACETFYGTSDGDLGFVLTNQQRTGVNITGVNCTVSEDQTYGHQFVERTVAVGDDAVITCEAPGGISISGKERFDIDVFYHFDEQQSLPRVTKGVVVVETVNDGGTLQTYIEHPDNLTKI